MKTNLRFIAAASAVALLLAACGSGTDDGDADGLAEDLAGGEDDAAAEDDDAEGDADADDGDAAADGGGYQIGFIPQIEGIPYYDGFAQGAQAAAE